MVGFPFVFRTDSMADVVFLWRKVPFRPLSGIGDNRLNPRKDREEFRFIEKIHALSFGSRG